MNAIFWLSARQLTDRRRFLFVVGLAAIPSLLIGVLLFADAVSGESNRDPIAEEIEFMYGVLTMVATLPTMVLLLTTVNFGDEVEDRTLIYLVAKPISRWRIVLPKLVASVGIATALGLISNTVAMALLTEADLGYIGATSAGVLVATLCYGAVFTWAGLMFKHALPIGLVYVVIWEIVLSSAFAGARMLSIRHFAYAVTRGLDGTLFEDLTIDVSASGAVAGTIGVVLLAALLTERRLRRMDIP